MTLRLRVPDSLILLKIRDADNAAVVLVIIRLVVLLQTRLVADHLLCSTLVLREQLVQHQQLLKVTDSNHLENLNPNERPGAEKKFEKGNNYE